MNWGYRIAILYIGFVVLILTLVFMSLNQDIQMVTENYYEKEQNYSIQVESSFNSEALATPLQIDYQPNNQKIQLQFPKDFAAIEGAIQFYRPSNAKKDFAVDIEVDSSNLQWIEVDELIGGLWKVKVDWKANGKAFFDEKQVVLQ